MGHLDEMYAKYRDRGLVVLAVTDEPRGLVDKFIADTNAKHPILIESGDSLRAFGGTGFPTMALIDPRGRIVVAGNPQESDIERLLDQTWTIPTLPKKLAPAQKSLDKGDFGGARKALEAQLAGTGLGETDRTAAEAAVKWIDDRGTKVLAEAAEDEKSGDAHAAASSLRRASESFKGLDTGTKAAAALKAILDDKDRKRAVEAGDLLDKNREKLRSMKPEQASLWCRGFVKQYEGTKAAESAKAMADRLDAQVRK